MGFLEPSTALKSPSSFPFHLYFLSYVMRAEGSSPHAYDPEEPRQAQTQTVTLLRVTDTGSERQGLSLCLTQTYGLHSGDAPLHLLSYNSSA